MEIDIELAGLILGILALILAIWHSLEIGKQAQKLKYQTDSLQKISLGSQSMLQGLEVQTRALNDIREGSQHILDKLSTRYIGQFPDFIENICICLEEADNEIIIACDVPTYGVFSNYTKSSEYIDILHKKKRKGIPVQIIVQTEEEREWVYSKQFEKKSWKELSDDPSFMGKLASFQLGEYINDINSIKSLEKKLKDVHNRTFDDASFGSEKHECSLRMPVYFWIADQRIAIFATPSWEGESSEHGFETRDVSLIRALLSIRQSYLEKSARVELK
jgi:hypothetical protein